MRREKGRGVVSGHSLQSHSPQCSPPIAANHLLSFRSGNQEHTAGVFLCFERVGVSHNCSYYRAKRFPIPCDLRLPKESASVRSARVLRFGGRSAAVLPNASGSDWRVSGPTAATIATRDSGVFDAPTKALGRHFSACNAVLRRESCRLAEFVRARPARRESLRQRLLVAQGLHGIDACGPSRGDETRRHRYRA